MAYVLLDENNKVIQKQPNPQEGFIEAPDSVVCGMIKQGNNYVTKAIPLIDHQNAKWEEIKAERDRRKWLGVKVGSHWFHSDDSSRIQQIGLVMMGANIPANLQWKTLTLTPPPVFVTMTPTLAGQIFSAVAMNDQAVFAACEAHRIAMEASPNPENYDFSSGWPLTIES